MDIHSRNIIFIFLYLFLSIINVNLAQDQEFVWEGLPLPKGGAFDQYYRQGDILYGLKQEPTALYSVYKSLNNGYSWELFLGDSISHFAATDSLAFFYTGIPVNTPYIQPYFGTTEYPCSYSDINNRFYHISSEGVITLDKEQDAPNKYKCDYYFDPNLGFYVSDSCYYFSRYSKYYTINDSTIYQNISNVIYLQHYNNNCYVKRGSFATKYVRYSTDYGKTWKSWIASADDLHDDWLWQSWQLYDKPIFADTLIGFQARNGFHFRSSHPGSIVVNEQADFDYGTNATIIAFKHSLSFYRNSNGKLLRETLIDFRSEIEDRIWQIDTLADYLSSTFQISFYDNLVHFSTNDGIYTTPFNDHKNFELTKLTQTTAPRINNFSFTSQEIIGHSFQNDLVRKPHGQTEWEIIPKHFFTADVIGLFEQQDTLCAVDLHYTWYQYIDNEWVRQEGISFEHANFSTHKPDYPYDAYYHFAQNALFSIESNQLYRSTDRLRTWELIVPPNTDGFYRLASTPQRLYAIGSTVSYTEDAGDTWTTLPFGADFLAASGDTIIRLKEGRLSKTYNYGSTWIPVLFTITNFEKIHPYQNLFIATTSDGKYWISENQGESWQQTTQIHVAFIHYPIIDNYWYTLSRSVNTYTHPDRVHNTIQRTFIESPANYPTGQLKGHLFYDLNGNGIQDADDTPYQANILKINPGPYHLSADQNGHFNQQLPIGNYNLNFPIPLYHEVHSQQSLTNISIPSDSSQQVHIGIHPIPEQHDLELQLTNINTARAGETMSVQLCLENVGTADISTPQIALSFLSYHLNPIDLPNNTYISGDSIYIEIEEIAAYNWRRFQLDFMVNPNTPISTDLYLQATATHDLNELTPENNQSDLLLSVTDAVDMAIEKQVSPEGSLLMGQHTFEYTIRFQNTGIDSASTIVVLDTLSHLLDPYTLQTLAASYNYQFELLDDRIARWEFANINLPDNANHATVNRAFIRFSIQSNGILFPDQIVKNQAAIYIGNNSLINTNEVSNFVEKNIYVLDTIYRDHCSGEDIYVLGDTIQLYQDSSFIIVDKSNFYEFHTPYVFNIHPNYTISFDTLLMLGDTLFDLPITTEQNNYTYPILLTSAQGCDSTINYHVQVSDSIIYDPPIHLCIGDSYQDVFYTMDTVHYDTTKIENGVSWINAQPILINLDQFVQIDTTTTSFFFLARRDHHKGYYSFGKSNC